MRPSRRSIPPAAASILFARPEQVSAGPGALTSLSPRWKTSAVIRSSLSDPPEIWAGPIGYWRQVTQRNTAVKPAWGEAKSLHWKNEVSTFKAGSSIRATSTPQKISHDRGSPRRPGRRGPVGLAGCGRFAIALRAPAILFSNPPARKFRPGRSVHARQRRDFGYGDFRDVLAGVEEALRAAPIDPNRLGLTGWSYGGFMTMWGVTQTNRFKAAMAGAGIANLQSYYGQNKLISGMIPFFGKSSTTIQRSTPKAHPSLSRT